MIDCLQAHYLEQTLLLDKVTMCFLCGFPFPKVNEVIVNYHKPLPHFAVPHSVHRAI